MTSNNTFQNSLGLFIGTVAAQATTAAGMAAALSKIEISQEFMAKTFNMLPKNPIAFRMAFPLLLGSFVAADVAIIPPILAVNHMTKN